MSKSVYKCEFIDTANNTTFVYIVGNDVPMALREAEYWIREKKPGQWNCVACERVIADLNEPRP